MSQYVTLSRAARLVGTSRAVLQKRIRNGDLSTFEGMIEVAELLRVFPHTKMEETAMLERAQQIMEQAVNKIVWTRTEAPDVEILAERVASLSNSLARSKTAINRQLAFIDEIEDRLHDLVADGVGDSDLEDFQSWFVQARRDQTQPESFPDHFTARDAFLRIFSADVKVLPSGHEYLVEGRDTLLEAALGAGCNLNYGCSDGSCGLCKARVVSGRIKQSRPVEYRLTDAERDAGIVLMCACTPVTDLVIEAQEASRPEDIPLQKIAARVRAMPRAGGDVWVVHLQTPRNKRLRFLAGQYATIRGPRGRSYDVSIASCPCHETHLEFHVLHRDGNGLAALFEEATKNADPVMLEGPKGNFTLQEDSTRPIVCVAWDYGFAPLKSIIEHAMALDVSESIHLYWIATRPGGHYMDNLCRSWGDALDNFKFTPLLARHDGGDTSAEPGRNEIEAQLGRVVEDYPDLVDFDLYVAGPDPVVEIAQKVFLSQGFPESRLFSVRMS